IRDLTLDLSKIFYIIWMRKPYNMFKLNMSMQIEWDIKYPQKPLKYASGFIISGIVYQVWR
ncbi:MAG: hypothetical protein ACUVTF_04190, partial [bacterium]